MPQNPISTIDFSDGVKTAINVNQPTALAGRMLSRIIVTTAGTTAGTIYDSAATSNCTTANAISPIPDTAGGGVIQMGIPVQNGIVIQPGSGQCLTVVYR